MKKKQLANLMMVIVILVIMAAGVLGVGYIRGWFDTDDGENAVISQIRGIVNLEREGVSFPAQQGTVLRPGDQLQCNSGATVTVEIADGSLVFGNSARFCVQNADANSFAAEITAGEVFVNTVSSVNFTFFENEIEFNNAVALLSVSSDAQSVSVFAGAVEDAQAGQMLNWLNGEMTVDKLLIQSLNDFAIAQLCKANKTSQMYFSDEELDKLEADRWAQKQEEMLGTQPTEPAATEPPPTEPKPTVPAPTEPAPTEPAPTEPKPTEPTPTEPQPMEPQPTEPAPTEPKPTEPAPTEPKLTEPAPTEPKPTEPAPTESKPTEPKPTEPAPTEPKPTEPRPTEPAPTEPPAPQYDGYCTITIRCDTILDNWEELDPAKAEFVPYSGVILPEVTVGFYEGETVFEVLNRVCQAYGIQLEYSWTPMYDSYYIEGINQLYEFDCGYESGWMYKVNGWFPNYGCSSYDLQGDETIVWCYTCKGLGADVGAERME